MSNPFENVQFADNDAYIAQRTANTNKRLLQLEDRIQQLDDLHEWTKEQAQEYERLNYEWHEIKGH